MEDDKKRKKTKKKKNKQNKGKEDSVVVAEEKTSSDQQHFSEVDGPSQVSENAFASDDISGISNGDNVDVPIPDPEKSGNNTNDCEALEIAETEKRHWLQKEALLEETINKLQSEKDTHMRKGARLEMRVVELEHEKESLLLKQAGMEGTISQLVTEKTSTIAKQASLEERIGQLIEDKAIISSKNAEYEERIKHLEKDKDLWVSKEVKLQEMIKSLEVDKETWILKQTSSDDMVGTLRDGNARLQNQVKELEESNIRILRENQMLSEKTSGLQVQLQNVEVSSNIKNQEISEISVLNSQIEAASHLIEKLVTENADLVEKVNELHTELDRFITSRVGSTQSTLPDSDSSITINDDTVSDTTDEINTSLQTDRTETTKAFQMPEFSSVAAAPVTIDSSEIVQIPLTESESQDAEGQETADENEDSPVELSDAPLTGAPIRFISFVARYVSGADLVSKIPTNSGK